MIHKFRRLVNPYINPAKKKRQIEKLKKSHGKLSHIKWKKSNGRLERENLKDKNIHKTHLAYFTQSGYKINYCY